MATVADALAALDGLGLPAAQLVWDHDPPPLPYVVLVPHESDASNSLHGSGGVAFEARRYSVELYCGVRDVALERRLSRALWDAGIPHTSDCALDERGQVAITYFNMTLVEQEA